MFQNKATTLRKKLKALTALLDEVGATHWSQTIAREMDRPHDELKVIVRGWFGTMGSLTDLYISPRNGDRVAPEEVEQINLRLCKLLGEIASLAR